MAAELIASAPIVEAMALDQRQRLDEMRLDTFVEPHLTVVATLPDDKPTVSYLRQMAIHADRVGLEFRDRYFPGDEDAALDAIHAANDEPGNATMVMMPLAEWHREQEVRDAINRWRDPDALGWKYNEETKLYEPEYPNYPATPLSALRLAEHAMGAPLEELIVRGDLEPERVVFYGLGKLVNRPAEEILQRRLETFGITDAKFTVISRENQNTHLIEDLGRTADVVIAAAGSAAAAGALRAEYLRRPAGEHREPIAVIDAAVCTGRDGRPYGNLNPEVYDSGLDFDIKVTPFDERRGPVQGVGPLTAAFLVEHAVQAAERDLAELIVAHR